MTTKEKAELMLSYQPGQEWEYQLIKKARPDQWFGLVANEEPTWDWSYYKYRRKPTPPQPKLRAWKPEEVPVGALLRHKIERFGKAPITMILCVRGAWVIYFDAVTSTLENKIAQDVFFNDYEHSLDHGKTWQPCGILE